ncbi:MAG: gliding motility-associated C-terminal domain-containing protein, partial [Bacteroidia bacterium]|nr:gliding motility-associated C-terminal domain-containing protein [Bacteroidia bacterium]
GNTATTANTVGIYDNNTTITKNYTVQLIGKDGHGCADTAYKTIRVFPKPNAYFEVTPTNYFLPDATVIPTNLTTGATTYNWFFGDGGSSNIQNPVYKYKSKGDYYISLIARSNRGCTDTFKIAAPISILDDTFFEMPNAFTPNAAGSPGAVYNPNDLSNDIFHPKIKGVETFQFTIYSKWGEVMFDTNNVNEGWDGYYKGKLCNQDVYVWKIVAKLVNGDTINKTGDVTLLR